MVESIAETASGSIRSFAEMGVVVTNAAIGEANRGRAAGANASSCGTTHISLRPVSRSEVSASPEQSLGRALGDIAATHAASLPLLNIAPDRALGAPSLALSGCSNTELF